MPRKSAVRPLDVGRRRSRRRANRVSCSGGAKGDPFFLSAPDIATVRPVGKVTAGDSICPAPGYPAPSASRRSGKVGISSRRHVGRRASRSPSEAARFPLLEEDEGLFPASSLASVAEFHSDAEELGEASSGGEMSWRDGGMDADGGRNMTVLEFCLQSSAMQAEERRMAQALLYGGSSLPASGLGAGGEWETAQTDDGRAYYVNHTTQETSWDPPDISSCVGPAVGARLL